MFTTTSDSTMKRALTAITAITITAVAANAAEIFVVAGAPQVAAEVRGDSWSTPHRFLTDAIAEAQSGDIIQVAEGVYFPDQSEIEPTGSGDRHATFEMKDGVLINCGWKPDGATHEIHDPDTYITYLDGDIGAAGNNADNSYTIVTALYTTDQAVLYGATLRHGNADETAQGPDEQYIGGGVFISGDAVIERCRFVDNDALGGAGIGVVGGSPTIRDCYFANNYGRGRAGGVELTGTTFAIVEDCLFEYNQGGYGGALYGNYSAGGRVDRCVFYKNEGVNGGAISFAGFTTIIVQDCLFTANESKQLVYYQQAFNGGAVHNRCATTKFINCVFNANKARGAGAAFYHISGPSLPELINCTFCGNDGRDGGTFTADSTQPIELTNCIFWGNPENPITGSGVLVYSSLVQDGAYTSNGSFAANPNFVDADGADNILGTLDDDLRIHMNSPAIDQGDESALPVDVQFDFNGNPRFVDLDALSESDLDLGAFEAQAPAQPCPADLDGSGDVGAADLATVISFWGESGVAADLDGSGDVGALDIATLIGSWGPCP